MLTVSQLATLRADINADGALSIIPNNGDGNQLIADAYNALAIPDFFVWMTNVSVQTVLDSITWANYTPVDVADSTAIYTNRLLLIQTKQMNLQTMLTGRDIIDSSKANVRAGLRDAVVALPSGTGGASLSAGGASGATVLSACLRKATRAEKLFSSGPVTTGSTTGNILVFEGKLTYQNVSDARAN